MRRLAALALAMFAFAGAAWAQPANPDQQAVLAADRALTAALYQPDMAAAQTLTRRTFAWIDRAGKLSTKTDLLRRSLITAAPASATESAATDVKVRLYGGLAVVTGRLGAGADEVVYLHVWEKRRTGWRAIVFQDTPAPQAAQPPPSAQGPQSAPPSPAVTAATSCDNPCKTIPYKPRSPDEQDIISAFQAIEVAVTSNDADTWVKLVTDDFMVIRTRAPPIAKAERIPVIRKLKETGVVTRVGQVLSMEINAFDDAAVITAEQVGATGTGPRYRVTRIFLKRDGRWQMALSQQTTVEP